MEQELLIKQSELIKNISEEFKVSKVICTTMSLDPSTMIQTIFQIAYPKLENVKVDMINAVLGCEKRFKFFHDKNHEINFEDDACLKRCLLDTNIVALKKMAFKVDHKGPVFHPKIILIEFCNDENEKCYRLLVSSKNLTSAYVYEVGVILKSIRCEKGEDPNHNFKEFLNFLSGDEDVKEIADVINNYRFVSVNDDCNENKVLIKVSGDKDGLGKQDSLKDCLEKNKDNMYILSPAYETPDDNIKKYFVYEPVIAKTHAKLYYLMDTQYKKNIVWIGSSNLSEGGLENNIECMVEINDAIGVEKIDQDSICVFGTKCKRVTKAIEFESNELAISELRRFIDEHTFCHSKGKLTIYLKDNEKIANDKASFCVKLYDSDEWIKLAEIDQEKKSYGIQGKSNYLIVKCDIEMQKKNSTEKVNQTAKTIIVLSNSFERKIENEMVMASYKAFVDTAWIKLVTHKDRALYQYGLSLARALISEAAINDVQKKEVNETLKIIEYYWKLKVGE